MFITSTAMIDCSSMPHSMSDDSSTAAANSVRKEHKRMNIMSVRCELLAPYKLIKARSALPRRHLPVSVRILAGADASAADAVSRLLPTKMMLEDSNSSLRHARKPL